MLCYREYNDADDDNADDDSTDDAGDADAICIQMTRGGSYQYECIYATCWCK